ncbi:hypothetical protein DL96DRAFT_1822124 [Flagelloscypha sp. PMI_526]|nr:hypothetical protein DL96DRAFT_1822124 [Flagelloscypha sp. PMI_526]
MSFNLDWTSDNRQRESSDMEVVLNAVKISYTNQEAKVLALQKLSQALKRGKTGSKLHLQPPLSELEEFLANGSRCDKEAFDSITKKMEDSYNMMVCEEKMLTESLRRIIPSSVLFIMSPSTYRCQDDIAHWIPVTLPRKEWGLFNGLEYKGKKPCWVTASNQKGTSGMVNSGIWLGLTIRAFGCSLDFLDGHWYSLIQRKEVDDFDGWVTYLAGYDCHIEVEW